MLGSLARHVKWFTDPSRHPTDYSLLFTFPVIAAFAVFVISWMISASRSVLYAKSPAREAEALKRQINAAAGVRA